MVSEKPWEIGHTHTHIQYTLSLFPLSDMHCNPKNAVPILHVGLVFEKDPSDFVP